MNPQPQAINIAIMPADFNALSTEDKVIVLKAMEISLEKRVLATTAQGTALTT